MKKNYIEPSVKVVMLGTTTLLAGSIGDAKVDPTKDINVMESKRGYRFDLVDEDFE